MELAEVKEYIRSEEDQNVKAAEFEIQKKKKKISSKILPLLLRTKSLLLKKVIFFMPKHFVQSSETI